MIDFLKRKSICITFLSWGRGLLKDGYVVLNENDKVVMLSIVCRVFG